MAASRDYFRTLNINPIIINQNIISVSGMIFYFGYGIHRSKVGQQNVEFYTSVPENED